MNNILIAGYVGTAILKRIKIGAGKVLICWNKIIFVFIKNFLKKCALIK